MCCRDIDFTCTTCTALKTESSLQNVILNKFLVARFIWLVSNNQIHSAHCPVQQLVWQLTNCTKMKKEIRQIKIIVKASKKYSRVLRVGSLEGIIELIIRAITAKMPAKACIAYNGCITCTYIELDRHTVEKNVANYATCTFKWTTHLPTHDSRCVLLWKDSSKTNCAALEHPTSHCMHILTG